MSSRKVIPFGGEHRKGWIVGPRVVALNPESAKAFFGFDDDPVDLGPPAEPDRYKPGARVFVFPRAPFTLKGP